MQEVIFINHFSRSFRVFIISFHRIISTVAHFSLHTYRTFFSSFGINYSDFSKFKVTSYRITTYIKRIIDAGCSHTGSCFCQSVYTGNLHIHLFFYLFHQFNRTQRTGHYASTQTRHIEQIKHRMVQLGNKHSRHPVEGRTAFFMNGRQHYQRIKPLYHHLRTTMSQTVHRSQHHSKTMEQRHTTTKFIISRKLHVFTSQKTVVGNIIMSQHHSLRKTGSS